MRREDVPRQPVLALMVCFEGARLIALGGAAYLFGVVLGAWGYMPVHALLALCGPAALAWATPLAGVAQVYFTAFPANFPPETAAAAVEAGTILLLYVLGHRQPSPAFRWLARHKPLAARRLLRFALAALLLTALLRFMPGIAHVLWAFAVLLLLRSAPPAPPVTPARRREMLLSGALFATSCLLAVAVIELTLQLAIDRPRDTVRSIRQEHPTRFWHYLPNETGRYGHRPHLKERYQNTFFRTNALGLRGREYGPKRRSEYRIVMLGDSYVLGWRLPETQSIPQQLERILADTRLNKSVTVVNAGIAGYGPWQARDLLHEIGFALEPDLVLHGVFPINDVQDTLLREGRVLRAYTPEGVRDRLQTRYRSMWSMRFEYWLYEHSTMFYVLQNAFGWPPLGGLGGALASIRFLPGGPVPKLPKPADRAPSLEPELAEWYPTLEEGFLAMIDDIAATCDDCLKRGIGYAAFLIPPGNNVNPNYLDYALMPTEELGIYEIGKSRRLTSEHLGLRNVPYCDITPTLMEADRVDTTYIPGDGHFSPHGTHAAAQALARFLLEEYWPIHHPDLLPGRGLLLQD
ncbi:MAG: SGNH/GDSL hydrolase family protein [Candidatus Hydrogenedentota bacterium]